MKVGDLVYDADEDLCAIVMDKSDSFPDTHWRIKRKPFYFYYTNGDVHEVWWHTYSAEHKAKIKVLNSTENGE